MKYLYGNKVNNIIEHGNIGDANAVVDNLVGKFYSEVVTPDDQKLIDLAFADEPKQKELDDFLKDWDIEAFGGGKALLLSYVMKKHPHLQFSDYERPRLAGLLKFYRFHNLQIIAHYTKMGKALNEAGIVPMILKGGAMKHMRPELSRIMGDIDILVPGDDFAKSCKIAEGLGYVYNDKASPHSVDLHLPDSEEGTIDVHRYLDLETNYDKSFLKDLTSRARREKVFGVDSFIPCNEDMVFIALINLAKNLHNNTSSRGILYTLFDCRYLIDSKPDFDWKIVIKNAVKTNAQVQLFFAIKFVNSIVKGLLPEDMLQNKSLEKEIVKYCNMVMFYRFYVQDIKMHCKKLKIKNALRNWEVFKDYLDAKPKHFVLKRIRKSHLLVGLFLKVAKKFKSREPKCA